MAKPTASGSRKKPVAIFIGLAAAACISLFLLLRANDAGFGTIDGLSLASTPGSSVLPVIPSAPRKQHPLVTEKYRRRDPSVDGWDSEVLNERLGAQLKKLAKLLQHSEDLDATRLGEIVADEFACTPLRTENLSTVFSDEMYTVYRGVSDDAKGVGLAASASEFRRLVEPFDGANDVRAKFKIIRVAQTPMATTTVVYYHASGQSDDKRVQQNAVWNCEWTKPGEDDEPLLTRIDVQSYEEVVGGPTGDPRFNDCSEAVLGRNDSFKDQFLPPLEHWLARTDISFSRLILGHHGLAIGDVNGDGRDDLFVSQPGGLPNRLYVQEADGTATDVSAQAGVDYLNASSGALLVDLDNDGDQDLVVALRGELLVMSNDGSGHFSIAATVPVDSPYSLAAADYDNDGDLDIYACCYRIPEKKDGGPIPYHDANNGSPNALLRNEGNWRFTDVTKQSGMDDNNRRFSFAASWEDYDNDGDMDLYVANDFGRNNLYRNDGGHFVDAAAAASLGGRWYGPPRPPEIMALVQAYIEQGHTNVADDYLAQLKIVGGATNASAAAKGLAEAQTRLGHALHAQGKHTEAVSAFRRAATMDNRLHSVFHDVGMSLAAKKRYAESIIYLREAVRAEPLRADVHEHLGLVYYYLDQVEQAAHQYEEALRLQPDRISAAYDLSGVLVKLGSTDEAISVLRQGVRRTPDSFEAQSYLGLLLHRTGKLDDAIGAYRAAMALKPDDAMLRYNLGLAYIAINDHKSAETQYEVLKSLNADSADVLLSKIRNAAGE